MRALVFVLAAAAGAVCVLSMRTRRRVELHCEEEVRVLH